MSCYLCHSNGPRAIRPNFDSPYAKISAWDRIKLFTWNLKIKSYGPLTTIDKTEKVPVRFAHPLANVPLTVKACTQCHNSDGLFARNKLTKQNFLAIRFMLQNKLMPPWPFKLDAKSRTEIEEFIEM